MINGVWFFFSLLQVNGVRVGNGVRRRTRRERRATRVEAYFTLPSSSVAPVSLTNFLSLSLFLSSHFSSKNFSPFSKLNIPGEIWAVPFSLFLSLSRFGRRSNQIPVKFPAARTLSLIKRCSACLTLASPLARSSSVNRRD